MAKGTVVPITPSVLDWAIRESGYSDRGLADELEISPAELRSWQEGQGKPNLTQFRKLSTVLRRTPSTFFLPAPPVVPRLVVSFRHPPNSKRIAMSPVELRHLREASRLQETGRWIASSIGEPANIPRVDIRTPPKEAAELARAVLEPLLPDNDESWSSPSRAFDCWRAALEALGVFVFLFPMGEDSAQGFSLDDPVAPIAAVNTAWQDQARIFTLLHEFGHLVTGTSSVCLEHEGNKFSRDRDEIERWCEEFAAIVILPKGPVLRFLEERFSLSPGGKVTDLKVAVALARAFKVSIRSAAIRLIELGFASWDLYAPLRTDSDKKMSGGKGEARDRDEQRQDRYGDRAIGLFVRALEKDMLGRADVLGYLDITDAGLSRAQQSVRPGV